MRKFIFIVIQLILITLLFSFLINNNFIISFAIKDLIYSVGMDINNKKLQTPIGVSCRICPRIECQQRAFPPIDKELKLDINFRGTSPYVTL